MRDVFSDCHPVVNFMFYIGAFVMGMCFVHPLFLAVSLFLSLGYYAWMKKGCLHYLTGMGGLIAMIAFLNPLFNTQGERVIFSYLGGRAYTWEALGYGFALAAMLVTILTWFGTYNQVMTSDKFLYCFGHLAPSVSLLLTMVLRLVPAFEKKSSQIGGARRCIGKSVENGSVYEKASHGMVIVSALTSWALEGGVVMADSMRSRGFGSGKRTAFSIYRMKCQDKVLLVLMTGLLFLVILCATKGGMQVSYTPKLEFSGMENGWTALGVSAYTLFLAIPLLLQMKEELTWRILRSRM